MRNLKAKRLSITFRRMKVFLLAGGICFLAGNIQEVLGSNNSLNSQLSPNRRTNKDDSSSSQGSLNWQPRSYNPRVERMEAGNTLNQVLNKDTTGMGIRRSNAQKGRYKQEIAGDIEEITENVTDSLKSVPKIISKMPDPHAKAMGKGAGAFLSSIEGIGKGISLILRAIGRYQERTQKVLSVNEQLLDMAEQSFEKMENLSENLDILVDFTTLPKSVQSTQKGEKVSVGTRLKKALHPRTWKHTVQDLLDKTYLTDFKTTRGQQIKQVREHLKIEEDNFEDYVRLLQIRLLEEAIKDIDKALHKDDPVDPKNPNKKNTIQTLDDHIKFLKDVQNTLVNQVASLDIFTQAKEREKQMRVLKEHAAKIRNLEEEKNFYVAFVLDTQTRAQFEEYRKKLREEINRIYNLTKLFKSRTEAELSENRAEFTIEEKEQSKKDFAALKNQFETFQETMTSKIQSLESSLLQIQKKIGNTPVTSLQPSPPKRPLPVPSNPTNSKKNTSF